MPAESRPNDAESAVKEAIEKYDIPKDERDRLSAQRVA
jgi:hypothetical protein